MQSEYLFNLIVNMTEGAESLCSLEKQIQQLRAQLSSQSNAAKQLVELQKENDYYRERNERMERVFKPIGPIKSSVEKVPPLKNLRRPEFM